MRKASLACLALALVLVLAGQPKALAATVGFQGRTYDVTIVPLGPTVPATGSNDLIFIQVPSGQKLLAIPTDPGARGDFDISTQRFYMLDRTTGGGGAVNAFSAIDATLVALDGTLFSTTFQNPQIGQPVLENIARPISIPAVETGVDVCILDDQLMGYRTDGPQAGLQKVYAISRLASSVEIAQFPVPLINADPLNANLSVFLEFDHSKQSFLLGQVSLDPVLNTNVLDRLSAFLNGTFDSEVTLENNTAFPNYSSSGVGIASDPLTGDIYILDSGRAEIIALKPQRPALLSVSPVSSGLAGGIAVTLSGVNLPPNPQVLFGTQPATVTAFGIAAITVTNPPNFPGAVDVTVVDPANPTAPLKLPGAFLYINTPPIAVLTASPASGTRPLTVAFDITGTRDPDIPPDLPPGTLPTLVTSVLLDFGDGSNLRLPADFSVLTVQHTYASDGTYNAVLTVIDLLNATAAASQSIVVGSGGGDVIADLFLQSLSFSVKGGGGDILKLKGEVVLPDDADLALAELTVAFAQPKDGSPAEFDGTMEFVDANFGAQFCATLDDKKKVTPPADGTKSNLKFAIKPRKGRFVAPGTFAFGFSGAGADFRDKLEEAVVNLRFGENEDGSQGVELTDAEKQTQRVGKVRITVRFTTTLGRELTFQKLAVVTIRPGAAGSSQLKLIRR